MPVERMAFERMIAAPQKAGKPERAFRSSHVERDKMVFSMQKEAPGNFLSELHVFM
jgi:hypothetical protein